MTAELRALLRAGMTFNTPLSEARAASLVERLAVPARDATVLDLGCGWGELLLRTVAAAPGASGLGLDLDEPSLSRGRGLALSRGLGERVRLEAADITRYAARAPVVICIGASFAWGPPATALSALHRHVEPGGLLLHGDAFWQSPPSPAAQEIFGELPQRDELLAAAGDAGFTLRSVELATLAEWDAFQAASLVGLEASPLPEARAFARTRAHEYSAYRGVLGFAYLLAEPR